MREIKTSHCYIRQRRDFEWLFEDEHFNASFWQHHPEFLTTIGGRGGSCLIEVGGHKAVLRRYYRGGAVSKLISDQYLWLGKALTRPWREWDILQRARKGGLPVPEPIAACACRTGLSYRAALITAYLEDTEMLTQRLQRENLDADYWYSLGLLVKRLHSAGIRHADLTSDNVLIDSQNRFYLVDFDQARVMNRIDDWQWRPLYRFKRSIEKRHRNQHLHFGEDDWQVLMDGYQS
ncbi:MAG: 3-deoxy-D-manno-octulosonic acid kinase [Gammaproteobacteria bacterium]|nr:3-deoxy-D-manno-octulosonic acid kinase [Gammaproteobacteria bacterium]